MVSFLLTLINNLIYFSSLVCSTLLVNLVWIIWVTCRILLISGSFLYFVVVDLTVIFVVWLGTSGTLFLIHSVNLAHGCHLK